MHLSEAKELIGQTCYIRYTDRGGNELGVVSRIFDATYVPLYGGYLVTQTDDIRFDRIVAVELQAAGETSPVSVPAPHLEKIAA